MFDLTFALAFLLTATLVGLPLARLLPAAEFPWRMLVAPVFGLGAVAICITAAYRRDLPIRDVAALIVLVATGIGVRQLWVLFRGGADRRVLRRGLVVAALAIAVLLLCLAPKWTGGVRYSVFQGNRFDQLNYMTQVATARAVTYTPLKTEAFEHPIFRKGQGLINARPAPQRTLAAFSLLFGADTITATYPYLAALQTFTFFAAAFLILQVFRVGFGAALLAAAAVTVGFPMQYIFDINAWGKLAGMSAVLVSMGVFLTTMVPSSAPPRGKSLLRRRAAAITLAVASVFYLYPEMLPVYGAGVIAAVAFWVWFERGGARWSWLLPCGVGLAGALVLGLLSYGDTLGFFVYELQFAAGHHVDWWIYFQGYLLGQGPLAFVVSALGLFFLLPAEAVAATIPAAEVEAWRIAVYLATAGVLASTVLAWRAVVARSPRAALLLICVVGSTLLIAATALTGRYWAAGEAWSMLAPLVYVAIVGPLLAERRSVVVFRAAAAVVVVYHLTLGVARPLGAMDESGIHFPSPYPAAADAVTKAAYDWDIHRYDDQLESCGSIGLDIGDAILERLVGIYLTDQHRSWESARLRGADFSTPQVEIRSLSPGIDCIIATGYPRVRGRTTTISLSMDKRLLEFSLGKAAAVDLLFPPTQGAETSGVYNTEPYRGGWLRWTAGEARIAVPREVERAATSIELEAWPVRVQPERIMRLSVDGAVLYEGTVPLDGRRRWMLPQPGDGDMEIEISIPPYRPGQDRRELGVPLRRLALVR